VLAAVMGTCVRVCRYRRPMAVPDSSGSRTGASVAADPASATRDAEISVVSETEPRRRTSM